VTQEEEDALERQNTSPLVRTRKGDSSLVKLGPISRGYLIYRRAESAPRSRCVPIFSITTTMTAKPQPGFVSLVKHHVTSTPRRFRNLSIRGKVSL
jgi:hypothetical protein